jgi:hypothetical protein
MEPAVVDVLLSGVIPAHRQFHLVDDSVLGFPVLVSII